MSDLNEERVIQYRAAPVEEISQGNIGKTTAATILDGHEVYGRYVEHYLAHKPSTITGKHYQIPNQEQFDNAIKWLGEQLEIE